MNSPDAIIRRYQPPAPEKGTEIIKIEQLRPDKVAQLVYWGIGITQGHNGLTDDVFDWLGGSFPHYRISDDVATRAKPLVASLTNRLMKSGLHLSLPSEDVANYSGRKVDRLQAVLDRSPEMRPDPSRLLLDILCDMIMREHLYLVEQGGRRRPPVAPGKRMSYMNDPFHSFLCRFARDGAQFWIPEYHRLFQEISQYMEGYMSSLNPEDPYLLMYQKMAQVYDERHPKKAPVGRSSAANLSS
ncbi:hypothetical protein KGQ71_01260 [Patescibacteria group bacterium]|nr:hypothetical protein [Patescibacteria group bacterium]